MFAEAEWEHLSEWKDDVVDERRGHGVGYVIPLSGDVEEFIEDEGVGVEAVVGGGLGLEITRASVKQDWSSVKYFYCARSCRKVIVNTPSAQHEL